MNPKSAGDDSPPYENRESLSEKEDPEEMKALEETRGGKRGGVFTTS